MCDVDDTIDMISLMAAREKAATVARGETIFIHARFRSLLATRFVTFDQLSQFRFRADEQAGIRQHAALDSAPWLRVTQVKLFLASIWLPTGYKISCYHLLIFI
jgi:hypothetical protein